jgi:NAD(P)-dependent dehydrogenase (short-subunit alcohol dehydrogenase family)
MSLLTGKVAVVTGGASGIGRASAIALAAQGATISVVDQDEAGAAETVAAITAAGGTAQVYAADIADATDVDAFLTATVRDFGRLDIAFNNAGIEGEPAATVDCTDANWARTLAVNLTGTWLCMRGEIPRMIAGGGGSIINCASIAGLVGFENLPAYVASKHGVVGLTRTAALEYAHEGICVNAICPGVIRTPMVERFTHGDAEAEAALTAGEPLGRMGEPEEIASAVVWLASPGASFTTGIALPVDGGWTAR